MKMDNKYIPYEHLVDTRTGEDMFFIYYDKEKDQIMCENLDGTVFWIPSQYIKLFEKK
jgi:hypothetical protein